jgi:hypothetical protein
MDDVGTVAAQILNAQPTRGRLLLTAQLNRTRKAKAGSAAWERMLHENAHLCTAIRELAEVTGQRTPWAA